MKKSFIVGKVADDKQGNPRKFVTETNSVAVTIYCGTAYNRDENAPKVHLNVTAWFGFNTDKVKELQAGDVVLLTGDLQGKKGKNGVHEINLDVDNNNLTKIGENSLVSWGIYNNFEEMAFIAGAFVNDNGYSVIANTNYYDPYYKKVGDGFERVDRYLKKSISYSVSGKSPAFRTINKMIEKMTGDTIEAKATQQQLDSLKGFYIVVESSSSLFSHSDVDVNGAKVKSLYMNTYIQRLHFVYQHIKGESNQKAPAKRVESNKPNASKAKAPAQGINDPNTPPAHHNNDDIPFPDLSEDGLASGFDKNVNF